MKASNPIVMIQAYRLLAARMAEEGMDYPFHLGVTEAGDGEEGRVKSAIGIGTLLKDGIGDTIRVSLTEDAVDEIPVAYAIAKPYNARLAAQDQVARCRACHRHARHPCRRKAAILTGTRGVQPRGYAWGPAGGRRPASTGRIGDHCAADGCRWHTRSRSGR